MVLHSPNVDMTEVKQAMTMDAMAQQEGMVESVDSCHISWLLLQFDCLFLATTQMTRRELSFPICPGVHRATPEVPVADLALVSPLENST